MPKPEKIQLIGHAIELTKLARGPVALMPAPTINADGSITLSPAQELENRVCARIFTEMYDFVQRVTDDETVFLDPADEASQTAKAVVTAATPKTAASTAASTAAGVVAAVAPAITAAAPQAASALAAASAATTAIANMLNAPLGAVTPATTAS
jgi:hypothetical protein